MKELNIIIQIPLESIQKENIHHSDGHCFICGNKLGNNSKFVQLLTNGNLINSDEDFEESQGFFPVGSECAKKLEYKVKFAF